MRLALLAGKLDFELLRRDTNGGNKADTGKRGSTATSEAEFSGHWSIVFSAVLAVATEVQSFSKTLSGMLASPLTIRTP